MGVEGAVVVDDVAVIVRVAHADSAVLVDLDVVVAVADIEFLDTALGFDGPAKGTVFFLGAYNLYDLRDEVVIVEAIRDDLAGVAVELCEAFDDCELYALFVECEYNLAACGYCVSSPPSPTLLRHRATLPS